ncbi:TPA: response regulator transcription factor [Klebsiella aerogenes]|uniref:response regulator transcription factor n=1 Tax=Klebsiella aerogenes TaxID=548 RepID=UPI000F7F315D|nr:response regulator transcription factor [Klebsiella aerogenes]MCU6317943.1 response regulator transcription factor [Klebsiella aerogenes]RSW79550.1 DNA-binding response regulator [Klebsiella aerogenes]HBS6040433.1 response regulator transcription factor [Klebsiella aerogenes]HEO1570698.1 response regulator transcription factor [Klebsiella aerogenes]
MQVIMFDRQSIFIHGMKVGLQQRIPEINIHSTCQAEQLWQLLTAHPQALLMLDGDLNCEFCCWLLQEKQQRFPHAKVLLVVSDDNKSWLQRALAWNVRAIAQREDSADMFAQIINSIMLGMMCLPGTWLMTSAERGKHAVHLSRRQQEILKLLAEGSSNKEISRTLNISAGTVKAHLESLYRRLDVKNRTQAAMAFNNVGEN